MIKLFITDLDGCLSIPFNPPSWDLLTEIRELNRRSASEEPVPALTICSGRPYPYVEAVAQWLDVKVPVAYESGGVYDHRANTFHENGSFDAEAEEEVRELKQWMRSEILPRFTGGILEFAKRMDAGFVHADSKVIGEALPVIRQHVREHYPRFEVHHTDISINVVTSSNNKRAGISTLCELLEITPAETAYIGDSVGDIPGLEIAGRSFAPQNAQAAVKEVVDVVLEEEATAAVLRAYREIVEANTE